MVKQYRRLPNPPTALAYFPPLPFMPHLLDLKHLVEQILEVRRQPRDGVAVGRHVAPTGLDLQDGARDLSKRNKSRCRPAAVLKTEHFKTQNKSPCLLQPDVVEASSVVEVVVLRLEGEHAHQHDVQQHAGGPHVHFDAIVPGSAGVNEGIGQHLRVAFDTSTTTRAPLYP